LFASPAVLSRHDFSFVLPISVGDAQGISSGASSPRERDSFAIERPVETGIATFQEWPRNTA